MLVVSLVNGLRRQARVEEVVQKYSNFVGVPIKLNGEVSMGLMSLSGIAFLAPPPATFLDEPVNLPRLVGLSGGGWRPGDSADVAFSGLFSRPLHFQCK